MFEHFYKNKASHHKQSQLNWCFLSLLYFLSLMSTFVIYYNVLRKTRHSWVLQTCLGSCLCNLQYEMNYELEWNINTREITIIIIMTFMEAFARFSCRLWLCLIRYLFSKTCYFRTVSTHWEKERKTGLLLNHIAVNTELRNHLQATNYKNTNIMAQSSITKFSFISNLSWLHPHTSRKTN